VSTNGVESDLGEIKDKAREVRDDVDARSADDFEAVQKAINELTLQLRANAANAADMGFARLDEVKEAVRRNPLQSLALAAGAGLIVGLWRRDSR
jgi:ElaB/YqjD/DUF883 family membrane-anchored ribosome-binding protein